MTEPQCTSEQVELTRLMRSIAREVANETIDEHLEEYKHKQKKTDTMEMEG